MIRATHNQLRYLAAVGEDISRDYTKDEASDLIGKYKAAGTKPNWSLADAFHERLHKLQLEDLEGQIDALKVDLESEGDSSLRREIRADIASTKEEIRELKAEYKQDLIDAKEDLQNQINEYQEELGPYGEYSQYIKKPNKKQVAHALEVLNNQCPEWESDPKAPAEFLMLQALVQLYPEIRKKNSPPISGVDKKSGCLSLIIVPFVMVTGYSVFSLLG